MRKTITAMMTTCSIALASCTTPVTPGTVTPGPSDIVAQVQQIATEVCGFLPIASTILGIFSSGSFTSAAAIANAICAAVTKKSGAKRTAGIPTVAGIQVRGTFVR